MWLSEFLSLLSIHSCLWLFPEAKTTYELTANEVSSAEVLTDSQDSQNQLSLSTVWKFVTSDKVSLTGRFTVALLLKIFL